MNPPMTMEMWKILGRIRRHVCTTGRPVWTARAVRINQWWESEAHDALIEAGLVVPREIAGGRRGYSLTVRGCEAACLDPDDALPFSVAFPTPF